jgi:hypothetical protein
MPAFHSDPSLYLSSILPGVVFLFTELPLRCVLGNREEQMA